MPYRWKAIYTDKKELKQYDKEKENKYPNIDRSKLASIEIYLDHFISGERIESEKPIVKFNLKAGQRLILRRRVTVIISGDKRKNTVIFLAGYQETIDGKNKQKIHVIYPDGKVEIISKWTDEIYSPNLMDCEK